MFICSSFPYKFVHDDAVRAPLLVTCCLLSITLNFEKVLRRKGGLHILPLDFVPAKDTATWYAHTSRLSRLSVQERVHIAYGFKM